MAKSSSSKSAAAPAPARAAAPVTVGNSTVTASAQQPNASDGKGPDLPREALVLDWDPEGLGNDASFEGEHGVGNDPTTDTQTSARGKGKKEKVSRQAGSATVEDPEEGIDWEQARHDRRFPSSEETDAADGDTEAEDGAADAATPQDKKARAEKREAVLKALARQKTNLGAENAAREARAAADAATRRATDAEAQTARAKTGTLAERLAFIGLTSAELQDAVIMNNGEIEAAAKKDGASNSEVAQLKADLAALKTKLDTAEQTRAQEATKKQIAESHATVAEIIKDEDVPLVHSENAYGRVLDGAWQAWKASGKKGAVADYVSAAAEVIEEQIETEKPRLAALKKAAKGSKASGKQAEEDDEERAARPERKAPKPSVGRRTGPSRIANRRDSLLGVIDGTERDRIIAREMGWTTG